MCRVPRCASPCLRRGASSGSSSHLWGVLDACATASADWWERARGRTFMQQVRCPRGAGRTDARAPSGIRVSLAPSPFHSILPCQGGEPRGLCLFCLRGGRELSPRGRASSVHCFFLQRDAAFHRAEEGGEEGEGGPLGFAEVIFVATMRVWRRVALLSFLLAAPPTPFPFPSPIQPCCEVRRGTLNRNSATAPGDAGTHPHLNLAWGPPITLSAAPHLFVAHLAGRRIRTSISHLSSPLLPLPQGPFRPRRGAVLRASRDTSERRLVSRCCSVAVFG